MENHFSSIYKTVVTYVTRSFISYFRNDSPMGSINPVNVLRHNPTRELKIKIPSIARVVGSTARKGRECVHKRSPEARLACSWSAPDPKNRVGHRGCGDIQVVKGHEGRLRRPIGRHADLLDRDTPGHCPGCRDPLVECALRAVGAWAPALV